MFIRIYTRYLFLLLLNLITVANSAQNYQLVWFENFSGDLIDRDAWTNETGGHGWGNNELQFYTSRSDNSFIEDGKLVIQAKKENYSGRNYTSARIISKGKKFFKYGLIEARIKLPYGKGIWPAFWMMGENISSVGWPACGEIDIMEMIGGGNNDRTIYGTAHWSNNGSHASYGGKKSISSGIFADDFHIFGIEWDETAIRWFLDGNEYHVIDITSSGLSEFHNEFFILLNVAVGGNWPGSPDASTVFPQRMEVDYIRVFQKNPTSVKELTPDKFNAIAAYPNPFNGQAKVFVNSDSHSITDSKMKIYNMLGEEIYSENISLNFGENIIEINALSNMNSGTYILTVNTGEKLLKTKLMYLK